MLLKACHKPGPTAEMKYFWLTSGMPHANLLFVDSHYLLDETIDGLKDQGSCLTLSTFGDQDLSRGPEDSEARFLSANLLRGWDLLFHRSQDKGGAK